jgi:ribosomal protein S18 acetylase RimI-like enzyme
MADVLRVREAAIGDSVRLAILGARTFVETYRALSHPVPEMIEHYAVEMFSVARVEAEIGMSGIHYLVLEDDGALGGYGKLAEQAAPAMVEDGRELWFLERLYLEGSAQGRGAGRLLLTELERHARRRGAAGLWLTVWERNQRAITFYSAAGFAQAGIDAWEYEWEGRSHSDDDRVMVKRF